MGKILDNPKEFLDKLNDKEFIELLNEMKVNFTTVKKDKLSIYQENQQSYQKYNNRGVYDTNTNNQIYDKEIQELLILMDEEDD